MGDKMKDNKAIKCDVESCVYCDCCSKHCLKKQIKICNRLDKNNKEATMCDSYKER